MDWVDVVRKVVPRRWRFALQRWVPMGAVKRRYFERANPMAHVTEGDENRVGRPVLFGIVANRGQYHRHFVAACGEIGVPFRVLDLGASDWLARVDAAELTALLAWPDATDPTFARVLKDRLDLLETTRADLMVVPGRQERWMYEDKVRLREWLVAHDIPHPTTWVFTDHAEARAFAEACELPVVHKTVFGAAATGVRILTRRAHVRREVTHAFGAGLRVDGHDPRDRQRSVVLFQEFVEVEREWRLVRIGDAYFGHPKGRGEGGMHSGSGRVEWDVPQARHLALLHHVTELGGFRSMALDAFETRDGHLLVNELQTVFGASTSVDQMRMNGQAGRMVRTGDGVWSFEVGDFARNACANARVLDALARLEVPA